MQGGIYMTQTMTEVLEFIEENDVKFIRLAFCDIFGKQKKHLHYARPTSPRL